MHCQICLHEVPGHEPNCPVGTGEPVRGVLPDSRPQQPIEVDEFRTSTQLLEELRAVINSERYDHITVSELVGVLEMLQAETLAKWMGS